MAAKITKSIHQINQRVIKIGDRPICEPWLERLETIADCHDDITINRANLRKFCARHYKYDPYRNVLQYIYAKIHKHVTRLSINELESQVLKELKGI